MAWRSNSEGSMQDSLAELPYDAVVPPFEVRSFSWEPNKKTLVSERFL